MAKKLQYGDIELSVSRQHLGPNTVEIGVNDQKAVWQILQRRGSTLTLFNADTHQVVTGACVETADHVTIWVQGQVIVFTKPQSGRGGTSNSTGMSGGFGPILAPMPGTVLRVLVSHGQTVEANTPVVIMESMKMELTIRAPQSGWVSHVAVSPSEMVAMGAPLLTVSAVDEAPDAVEKRS